MFLLFLSILSFPLLSTCAERHMDHQFAQDDIIELPVGRFPDPECLYTVRKDSENGPKVDSQVRVGDAVFHEWSCSHGGKDSGLYCLMVHNCTVSSRTDRKDRVPILDEFGCSLFPSILPHVEYPQDLKGGLFVHAFSLDVDQAAIFFECNVKLLLKLNGVCRRPTCPPLEELQRGRTRGQRNPE